jgi:protein-tyrosine kinase
MNRLFEALSEMETGQLAPKGVPLPVVPHFVIQLGLRAVAAEQPMTAQEADVEQSTLEAVPSDASPFDVAQSLTAQEAETQQLAPEVFPSNVSPFDVAQLMTAQERETEQLALEAVPSNVPPFDLAQLMTAQETEIEQFTLEAVHQDTSPFEMAQFVIKQEAETLQFTLETVPQDTSPFDMAQSVIEQEAETQQFTLETVPQDTSPFDMAQSVIEQEAEAEKLFLEVVPADVSASDVAQPMTAQEAEAEKLFLEVVPADASASDVAQPMTAQEAEAEKLFLEVVPADASASDVAQPMTAQEAETEQLSPEALPPDATPTDVAPQYGPEVRPDLPWPTEEAAVAKDFKPKSAKSAEARPVPVKVLPESRLVAFTDPNSLGAEKFRALVTRLEHVHKQSELKSFQVTSSVTNEGKTLVSGNVAVTLAKHFGSRTLLVEGDLHRPTLGTIFGLNKLRGLSHWWSSRNQDLTPFIHRLGNLPLWYLPAGNPCDQPSDILRSARFVKAFENLASQFEWVVVDSPPMLPIVDVNLWSRLVDGTLLVVREGVTPVQALKQGLLALDHPKLVGVVLNEASATNTAKYDGQYYSSSKRK